MPDVWDEILMTASIGGLEFPVKERKVTGGRAWAARKYPFRNGQDSEDTGQEPRRYEYTVELFADVDPGHYPFLRADLVALIEGDEAKGIAELVDPEDGPLMVRMLPYEWSSGGARRNGGTMSMTFETVGDDIAYDIDRIQGAQSAAQDNADSLDLALSDAGVGQTIVEQGFEDNGVGLLETEKANGTGSSFGVLVDSYITTVGTEALDPEQEIANVDTIRRRLESVLALDEANAPSTGWPIRTAVALCINAVTDIGQERFRDAPRVVRHVVNGQTSAIALAVKLFGDPGRADEIVKLNPSVSSLFIPAGAELVVPIV